MGGEWRICRLGEAPLEVIDGDRGRNYPKQSDFLSEGHCLFLNAGNVTSNGFSFSNCAFISEERDRALRKGKLVRNDVVLTTRGTIGNVAFYNRVVPYEHIRINSGMVVLRAVPEALDPTYLYSFVRSSRFVEQVAFLTTGSAQPQLPVRDILQIEIPLPPIPEQRAIAHILGTLDDKIELNRRMNETLEATAQALFKSWFVDFDPVRAKAEGRDLGLPPHLAALFPDRLVESEFGEVPEGWEVGTLADVLKQRVERCEASDETASRPYVPIDCISPKSLFLEESKPGGEAQSSLTRFYKGDLLFGAMRPYFHKVCIAPFDGTTRTTAFVLVPQRSQDFGFAALLLHHPDTIDYATRHSTGTTIPYAVWTRSLEDMPALIPPPPLREGFNAVVRPMLDRIPAPYSENRTLSVLRDTLLPKLVSGEIRLKDAEKFSGRAI